MLVIVIRGPAAMPMVTIWLRTVLLGLNLPPEVVLALFAPQQLVPKVLLQQCKSEDLVACPHWRSNFAENTPIVDLQDGANQLVCDLMCRLSKEGAKYAAQLQQLAIPTSWLQQRKFSCAKADLSIEA